MDLYHLAEFNIARCRAPLDTPLMQGFVEQLDALNALADESPGFIWRFRAPQNDPANVRLYDDPLIIANLSVWTNPESLKAYAYRSGHAAAYKRRADWFVDLEGPPLVLWWIPAGTQPTIENGRRQLEYLAAHGATENAFNFKSIFPQPRRKTGGFGVVEIKYGKNE